MGCALAYAIVSTADGRVLGSTRFTHFDYWFDYWQGPMVWPVVQGMPTGDPLPAVPDAAVIGNTWLSERARSIRRAHSRGLDGAVRSTAFYSILDEEWPAVRARITAELTGPPRLLDA